MASRVEIPDSLATSMREFGLTDYETSLYFELTSRQEANAAELSETSGIAYTKVYSVLSSLTRKGLVEIMRGKPVIFRTIDPEKSLTILKQNKIEGISKAYEKAISSLRAIRPSGVKPLVGEHGASWNISGKRNVINKLIEELGEVKKNVKVVFPEIDLLGKPILRRMIGEKPKVSFQILVSRKDRRFMRDFSGIEVGYSGTIKSRYAILDDKYCLMMAVETPDYWTGVFETCGNCTRQAHEHFQLAWKSAVQS